LGLGLAPAWASKYIPLSLDEAIDRSEAVLTAVCVGKETAVRAGNIVTTYRLRPLEFWKGTLRAEADGTVHLEQIGGSLKGNGSIPLAQYIVGTTPILDGEEVLIFARTFKPPANRPQAAAAVQTPLTPGAPTLLTPFQGRYSVLTDPQTGEKFVVNPGARAALANEAMVRRQLERLKGVNSEQRRALREMTGRGSVGGPQGLKDFESLDDVRAYVLTYVSRAREEPNPGRRP